MAADLPELAWLAVIVVGAAVLFGMLIWGTARYARWRDRARRNAGPTD